MADDIITGDANLFATPEDITNVTPTQEDIQGIDPPVKKAQPSAPDTGKQKASFDIFSTKPDEGKPVPKKSTALDAIGQFVPKQYVQGAERNLGIDLNDYAEYFGNNTGYIPSKEALDSSRAQKQSTVAQFGNAVARIGLNIIPEIIGQAGNVLDIEDYLNADKEVGNWLSNLTKSFQEGVNEEFPIYRENPNQTLDIGDPAYWMENGANLVTSAGAFVALGMATGGASLSAITKGAKAVQWLRGGEAAAAAITEGSNAIRGVSALTSAVLLNQAESVGIGVNVFDNAYKAKLTELQGNPEYADLDPIQLQSMATETAANKATEAINFNKINIMLNLTGANLLLKSATTGTRQILNAPSIKRTLGTIGTEGAQEYAEETINDISEERAMTDNYSFKDGLNRVMSEEGFESGLLGFLGGAGQVALGKVGKSLPIYTNMAYRNEYNTRLAQLEKDTTLTEEQKDVEARKYALDKAGISNNRISDVNRQRQAYTRQQDAINNWNNLTNVEKLTDSISELNTIQQNIDLQAEITKAKEEGNFVKAENLSKSLLEQQAYHAFETGTTDSLENIYKGLANLSKEEAAQKGIYTEGDEDTDNYYKTKMNKAVKTIQALEKEYNISRNYLNQNDVYNVRSNQLQITNSIQDIDSKIAEKVEESRQYLTGKDLETLNEINKDNINNIKILNSKFADGKLFKEIQQLYKARREYEKINQSLQDTYINITDKSFQNKLAENIKKFKEANRKKENKKAFKKVTNTAKKATNTLVNTINNSIGKNTDQVVEDVNTEVSTTSAEETQSPDKKGIVVDTVPNDTTDVTSKSTAPKSTIGTQDIITKFTPIQIPMLDNALSNMNKMMEDKNVPLENKLAELDRFQGGLNNPALSTVAPTFTSITKENIISSINSIKEEINNQIKQSNEQVNTLADQQNALVEDLETDDAPEVEEEGEQETEDTSTPLTEQNQEDILDRAQRRVSAMIEILRSVRSTGIDLSDFKAVIKSFENNVDKARVQKVYTQLKNVYNVATDKNIEVTYEELMYDDITKSKIVKDIDDIATFSLETELYTPDHDKTTKANLSALNDIAIENDLDARYSGFEFDSLNSRGKVGHNKLAYLAKDYDTRFEARITESGNPYIAVTKSDINNLLNVNLSDRVLNGSLKPGTNITFVALDSIEMADGSVRDSSNTTEDDAPIGVAINGELIDGLYLHDVNWINFTNVNNDKDALINDQESLRKLRKYILERGQVNSTITQVGPGIPIIDTTGEYNVVSENLPNAPIGVIRNGRVEIDNDSYINVINKILPNEGTNVVVITLGNGTKSAIQVSRTKLQDSYKDSIIHALDAFISRNKTQATDTLALNYGIDVLTSEGIERYITKFLYGYNKPLDTQEDFTEFLNQVKDNVNITQFKSGEIRFGRGQGINTGVIVKDKNMSDEDRKALLDRFRVHLNDTFTNLDLTLKSSDFSLPIIGNDGKVTNEYENYNDFIGDNLLTNHLSFRLNNGKDIYTVQSTIEYDTSFITNINTDTSNDSNNSSFIGKSEFDNITEEFDAPEVIDDSTIDKNLLEQSTLIPNVSIANQVNLIKDIVNTVYQDLIEKSEYDSAYQININSAVDLKLEGLRNVKHKYIAKEHPQAANISKQVDSIIENRDILVKSVERRINKFSNIKNIQTIDNSNDEKNEDDANDLENEDILGERNIYLDTALYAVDPKTQLRSEIQKLLADIVDYKTEIKNGQIIYVERINQFLDNVYVGEDEVYKTIMSILATNKTSFIYPTFDNYIKALRERIPEKPFLKDVVEKLEYEPEYIQNAFVTGFSKHATHHIYLQQNYNASEKLYSLKPIASNSKNLPDLVINEWQNKIRIQEVLKPDGRNLIFNPKAITEFNRIYNGLVDKSIPLNYSNIQKLVGILGIDIPPALYQRFANEGVVRKNSSMNLVNAFTQSGGIFKIIHTRVNRFSTTKIDLQGGKELDLDKLNLFSDQAFKDLARYIAMYRNDLFSNSHKDGNNNNIYSYSNNKYIVDRFGELKSDNQLINDYLVDPFAKNSIWLNSMIQEDEEGITTLNKDSLFYRYFEYDTLDSVKVKNNKGKMVDTLDLAEFEKMKLSYFYNQGNKVAKNIPIMRFVFPTMSDKSSLFTFQALGKNYELVNNQLTDSDVQQLAKILFYPEINRIKQYEANPDLVKISEYKLGAGKFLSFPFLNEVLELWITDEDGNKSLHPDVGVTQDKLNILKQEVRNFINSEIQTKYNKWVDYGIITTDKKSGAKSLTFIDKEYSTSYGNPGINSVLRNFVINNIVANLNMQQLFIGDPALYTKPGKDAITSAYNTNDNQLKRLAADNAGKTNIIADKDERFNLLIVKDKYLSSIGLDYLNTLGNNIGEDYKKINGTDAQEYTTLKEHLTVMFKQGEISKENMDEIMYRYNTDRDLDLKHLKIILSPNKPVYANNYMRDGVMSRLYVKSSSIPLIKQFTIGSPIDELRKFIERKDINIDRVAFESAVKVGMPSTVINIFDSKGSVVIPDNWEDSKLVVPRYGHGIQNKVPYEPKKDRINYGSQRAKMLFNNLHEVQGFIDPISGQEVTGRELSKGYNNSWRELYKTKYDNLVNELKYDPITGSIDITKLESILLKEAVTRNYNINDLAGLKLNQDGNNFEVPLYLNNNESKINSLLNSIVDNRIRKIKVKGKSFVLVSEEGHEKTKLVDQEDVNLSKMILLKGWNGRLNTTIEDQEDGKIKYAEVLIPFKFWDNKGDLLNLQDFTKDGFIDTNKLPSELLELFGFRIPTQGLSSMSMIKVVGFVPSEFGDIIIASRDFIQQMGSDFDVDKLYTQMYNTLYEEKTGNLYRVKPHHVQSFKNMRNIKDMMLENQILDYVKAVFNNPSIEVQGQRAKALGFGNLKELATRLFVTPENRYWSPLSEDFQSYRYMGARAGKALVGAFSLDSVFNSVLQEVEEPINFMVTKDKVSVPDHLWIAGRRSSDLNNPLTADGKAYKSDVISAFQSAALDDAKEQLLYKLNINNNTSDAIRAMAQMGYDEEVIISVINQPSVKTYVNNINLGKGNEVEEDFTSSQESLIGNTSTQMMEDYIKDDITTGDYQDAVVQLFIKMTKRGKQLKSIQSIINSDSAGIGKNMFYTLAKVEGIISLGMQSNISNISKVIGDYQFSSIAQDKEEWEAIKKIAIEEGYVAYDQDTLIKPNTINGFASVYATLFSSELWRNYFPYNYTGINIVLTSILNARTDNFSTINQRAEALQETYTEYKSYLASSVSLLSGNSNDTINLRRDLVIDTATHMSLGSIVADIKSKNKIVNPFIDRLKVGDSNKPIDTSGKIPTNITMINASSQEMEEEVIINSITSLIVNPVDLGEYNGKNYTTRDLMRDLIYHQLITMGVQKSSQFIKYIPVSYLRDIGYYAEVERQIFNRPETGSTAIGRFSTQYVQHNPEKFYKPNLAELIDRVENGVAVLKDTVIDFLPRHLVRFGNNAKGYEVFKLESTTGDYMQIDVLGDGINNEYDVNADFAGVSLIYINQAPRNMLVEQGIVQDVTYDIEVSIEEVIPSNEQTENFLKLNRDTTQDDSPIIYLSNEPSLVEKYSLNDNISSIKEKYDQILNAIVQNSNNPIQAYFASKLLPITEYFATTPIYVDNTLNAKGRTFTTRIKGEPIQIRINPSKINGEQELQDIVLEEIVHATLKQELLKNTEESRKIKRLYNDVREKVINKFGREAYETMEQKRKDKKPLSRFERDVFYNVSSIDEFLAGAINNREFQKVLNNIDSGTKSLWNRIIDTIKEFLVSLGVVNDSELQGVLSHVLGIIDTIDKDLQKRVTVPKYVRSKGYLQAKFNLVNSTGELLSKINANDIADFINSNIANVYANVIDDKVQLGYNIYNDITSDDSPEIVQALNLKVYIDTISVRLEKLKKNLDKARQSENFAKVAIIEEDLQNERDKLKSVKEIDNLVDLAAIGEEELLRVDEILKRDMSAEDILYVRSTINFWKNAKEYVFDEMHLESETLSNTYSNLERLATTQHLKLIKIEKKYLEDFVKFKTGKELTINDIFDNYKDVNAVQSLTKDISTFDNELLSSIFIAVKEANVDTEDEANEVRKKIDSKLDKVLPILQNIDKDNPFDIFRQRNKKGLLTGHLVDNFTSTFYKERSSRMKSMADDNNAANFTKLVNWYKDNTIDIDLAGLFSINGELTEEQKKNREKLKEQLGTYTYNKYIESQERKIQHYENSRLGLIEAILDKFNLETATDINNNQGASDMYSRWIYKSSPFNLNKYIKEGIPSYLGTYKNFNSQNYYEVIPVKIKDGKDSGYYDNNFSKVESDPTILDFYDEVKSTMKELKKYLPLEQQKTLAYNGLPEIEKTLIEQYSERGLKIGYKPILEALQKSVQTNYSDYALGTPDPITQQPQKNMRVGMIINHYKEVQDYISLKSAEYLAANGRVPNIKLLTEWEEFKVNELAENKSFDLGKVLKVFSVGVLGYKHKAKIEDNIKIATNVIDSMREAETRGDGTVISLAGSGRVLYKDAGDSYTNLKLALEHFINLNLYNDSKEEEGRGKKILTTTEREQANEIEEVLRQLEESKEAGRITKAEYADNKRMLEADLDDIGFKRVYSKYGDNVLKYFQVLGMGWNVLGGIANIGFGFMSNVIEGSGNQLYNNKDLAQAYKLVSASILKNVTFNKVQLGESKKIRELMDKWNVLKDSSQELFQSSTPNTLHKNLEWLKPMNANQRGEYLNQAPLMIAMAKATKVKTEDGEIDLYEGYDEDGKWQSKYGEEPVEIVKRYRLKLDQAIAKRIHGNYDPVSSPRVKRHILGRAAIQFRTWLIDAIAVRFEKERYDDVLDTTVKGRYRSVWETKKENLPVVGLELVKSIIRQGSFNTIFKDSNFDELNENGTLSDTDAANLRRVSMEVLLAINVNLALLALTAALKGDDDDDNYVYNTLFNQGLRLRTDILLYVNPAEGRKLFKDIIPAITLIDNTKNWLISGGNAIIGEDTYETGEYSGDSKFARSTAKIIPFATQGYRMYSSSIQEFN